MSKFRFSFGPPGWQDIPDDPDSFLYKMTDAIGSGIDRLSDLIMSAAIQGMELAIRVMEKAADIVGE